jgi:hypothetical protein
VSESVTGQQSRYVGEERATSRRKLATEEKERVIGMTTSEIVTKNRSKECH